MVRPTPVSGGGSDLASVEESWEKGWSGVRTTRELSFLGWSSRVEFGEGAIVYPRSREVGVPTDYRGRTEVGLGTTPPSRPWGSGGRGGSLKGRRDGMRNQSEGERTT